MFELIVILALILFSLRERIKVKVIQQSTMTDILNDSKASVFSEAIGGLVATAGGIYLSLMLVATFLSLELPSTVYFLSLKFEPLAGTSILLALVQPFILKLWYKIVK